MHFNRPYQILKSVKTHGIDKIIRFSAVCLGSFIREGFFDSKADILVPVRQSPSSAIVKLILSKKAYVTYSEHIYAFLSLPLVPFTIAKNEFFNNLKARSLILEVDDKLIKETLSTTILLAGEMIAFLNWLCEKSTNNKQYIDNMLSCLRFRHDINSPIATLLQIKFFDSFNVPYLLPLPCNVLPAYVVDHFSREILTKRLYLSGISLENLVEFYMHKDQQHVFLGVKTAPYVLSFISFHWHKLNEIHRTKIKTTLSSMKCIPTTQGMKLPKESYIPSTATSTDQALIRLNIGQPELLEQESTEHVEEYVTIVFLSQLGCRMFNLKSLLEMRKRHGASHSALSSSKTLIIMIQQLTEERKKMTASDFTLLKASRFLPGIWKHICMTMLKFYENICRYDSRMFKKNDAPVSPI